MGKRKRTAQIGRIGQDGSGDGVLGKLLSCPVDFSLEMMYI